MFKDNNNNNKNNHSNNQYINFTTAVMAQRLAD